MPLGASRFGLLGVADLGSLELIEEKSISAVSSAIFTDIKETKYDVHFMTVNNFKPSNDGIDIRIRFFENGVEESASVYQFALQYGFVTGLGFGESKTTSIDRLRATVNVGNATNETGQSYCYFYNLGDSSKYSFQTMQTTLIHNTSGYGFTFGGGVLPQASVVDQIKLFVDSGTFDCTAKLYGVKQL